MFTYKNPSLFHNFPMFLILQLPYFYKILLIYFLSLSKNIAKIAKVPIAVKSAIVGNKQNG